MARLAVYRAILTCGMELWYIHGNNFRLLHTPDSLSWCKVVVFFFFFFRISGHDSGVGDSQLYKQVARGARRCVLYRSSFCVVHNICTYASHKYTYLYYAEDTRPRKVS